MNDLIFKNVNKELEQIANECLEGKELLVTKFGRAKLDNHGYYQIKSRKEGYHNKKLHKLIWEEHYGKSVPKGYHIHHINGNKLDNRIQNLQCVEASLHARFHRNSSGYYRVGKEKRKDYKQGFVWRYRYFDENGKEIFIRRANLDDLEKEVKKRGQPWIKIQEL